MYDEAAVRLTGRAVNFPAGPGGAAGLAESLSRANSALEELQDPGESAGPCSQWPKHRSLLATCLCNPSSFASASVSIRPCLPLQHKVSDGCIVRYILNGVLLTVCLHVDMRGQGRGQACSFVSGLDHTRIPADGGKTLSRGRPRKKSSQDSQPAANKGSSRYRGVSWNSNCNRWRAQVRCLRLPSPCEPCTGRGCHLLTAPSLQHLFMLHGGTGGATRSWSLNSAVHKCLALLQPAFKLCTARCWAGYNVSTSM